MFANPIARTSCAIALALALAVAVRVGGADAQQPSPTAIATAKEVITVKGAAALWDPLVPGVVEQAKSVFVAGQSDPAQGPERSRAQIACRVGSRSHEVVNEVAKLYAARFTEQELKDALAFYKSPLGKKLSDRGALDARPEHEKRAELGRPAVARGHRQDPHRNEATRPRDLANRIGREHIGIARPFPATDRGVAAFPCR